MIFKQFHLRLNFRDVRLQFRDVRLKFCNVRLNLINLYIDSIYSSKYFAFNLRYPYSL